jgi:type VI secretion system protein ImpC
MSHATGSRVRWLIAGTFSPSPRGRAFAVSGERFSDVLAGCRLSLEVDVTDCLGTGSTRSFEVSFKRPRDFRVEALVAQQTTLRAIAEIADALERSREPISPTRASDRLRALVGDGVLALALAGPPEDASTPAELPEASTTSRPSDPSGRQPDDDRSQTIDAIFAKAAPPEVSEQPARVRSGLDAFIGAMRGQTTAASPTPAPLASDAAAVVRAAVDRTALAILAHPRVAELERSWRGLRMVMAESPGHDELVVEALDVTAEALPDTLDRHLSARTPDERPDAVFVTHDIDDAPGLQTLAQIGARHHVVVVAGVDPSLAGLKIDARGWPEEPTTVPDPWSALREDTSTGWLIVAANPIVVANEPLGADARLAFASPTLGIAALLSATLARTGLLEDCMGRSAGIRAPAAQDVDVGREGPAPLPTRWPASPTALQAAAEHGITLLGHDRDRFLIVAAPTLAAGEPAQLPTRILLERARRLATQIRQALPPNASRADLDRALDEAAANFLPRMPRGAIRLEGGLESEKTMQVQVRFGEALGGSALALEVDLEK